MRMILILQEDPSALRDQSQIKRINFTHIIEKHFCEQFL